MAGIVAQGLRKASAFLINQSLLLPIVTALVENALLRNMAGVKLHC